MTRYLTWRNIFGVLLLTILVMIWPLEWIGWYSVVPGSAENLGWYYNYLPHQLRVVTVAKINAITGHVFVWVPPNEESKQLEEIEHEVLGKPLTAKEALKRIRQPQGGQTSPADSIFGKTNNHRASKGYWVRWEEIGSRQ